MSLKRAPSVFYWLEQNPSRFKKEKIVAVFEAKRERVEAFRVVEGLVFKKFVYGRGGALFVIEKELFEKMYEVKG